MCTYRKIESSSTTIDGCGKLQKSHALERGTLLDSRACPSHAPYGPALALTDARLSPQHGFLTLMVRSVLEAQWHSRPLREGAMALLTEDRRHLRSGVQ
jgi:hypothetical protein